VLALRVYRRLVPQWDMTSGSQDDKQLELMEYFMAHPHALSKLWTRGIELASEGVKLLQFVLEQVGRFNVSDYYSKWEDSRALESYLNMLLEAFCHEEVAVAKTATDVLVHVFCDTEDDSGAHWLFDELVPEYATSGMQDEYESFDFLQQLQQKARASSINYLRYLELILAIASQSEQFFTLACQAKLLDDIIERLQISAQEDLLELLNVLELIQKLVAIPFDASVQYMIHSHVFEIISQQLFEQFTGDPMVEGFLMAAIGQLTTMLGEHLSGMVKKYMQKYRTGSDEIPSSSSDEHTREALEELLPQNTFLKICNKVDDSNKRIEIIALRVVSCVLATSSTCMQAFLGEENAKLREKYFEHMFLGHSTDAQEVFLQGMAQILLSPILSLDEIESFFKAYVAFHKEYKDTTTLVDELIHICKVPFAELRFAAYELAQSLASHPFSAKLLLQHNLFLREMLNRKLEQDRACMEKKYECLVQLSDMARHNEDLRKMLSNTEYIELRTYIHRGAFWNDEAAVLVQEEAGGD